jgi:hypothetical protein
VAANALKKASWLMAAATAALGYAQGSVTFMVVVVVGTKYPWRRPRSGGSFTQTLAIPILSIEETGSHEPKEQEHASRSGAARKSVGS